VSSREAALLEQRQALNERLAIDASMTDIMWRDEMPLQLQWLRQPASLLWLLQRPVWLDAWRRGEEERASLLWRGLPNHVMLHILKLRTVNKWKTAPPARGIGVWGRAGCAPPGPSRGMGYSHPAAAARHKGMWYGVWGMGYGVQPSEQGPRAQSFLAARSARVILVRNFFGACGGRVPK